MHVTQQATQHHAQRAVFRQDGAAVKHHLLQMVPHPGLMQAAHGTGQQARSHQQDEHAGIAEELAHVDAHPALVQAHAQQDGQRDTCERPHRCTPARALLEDGQQEEDRLQPFARHGQKHHADQCPAGAARCGERLVHRGLQFALDGARSLAHPEHHACQHANGDETYDGLKQLLLLLRKLCSHPLQASARKQRQAQRKENACPYGRHQRGTARMAKKTGNDANDQRGFDALAQHDQKRNQHGCYGGTAPRARHTRGAAAAHVFLRSMWCSAASSRHAKEPLTQPCPSEDGITGVAPSAPNRDDSQPLQLAHILRPNHAALCSLLHHTGSQQGCYMQIIPLAPTAKARTALKNGAFITYRTGIPGTARQLGAAYDAVQHNRNAY